MCGVGYNTLIEQIGSFAEDQTADAASGNEYWEMPAWTDVIAGCPQTIIYELVTTDPITIDTATNPGFVRVVPNNPTKISYNRFQIKV